MVTVTTSTKHKAVDRVIEKEILDKIENEQMHNNKDRDSNV